MNISSQMAILQSFVMQISTAEWKLRGQIILKSFFSWRELLKTRICEFCCARSTCLFLASIYLFRDGLAAINKALSVVWASLKYFGQLNDIWFDKSFTLDNILGCIQSPAQLNPAVWDGAICENSQSLRPMAVFTETFFFDVWLGSDWASSISKGAP